VRDSVRGMAANPANSPRLRPFQALLNSRADLQRVTATVHDLVAISFITHPVRDRTEAEIRRRGTVVIDAFRMMRAEKGFSQSRALALLPHALKHSFDNPTRPWEPPAERLYRVG
jgi:hypothetical protein